MESGEISVICRLRKPCEVADSSAPERAWLDVTRDSIRSFSVEEAAALGVEGTDDYGAVHFTFDAVCDATVNQAALFALVEPIVRKVGDGYNGTIFAYGQTASGKTYTMEGPSGSLDDPELMGVIPRVLRVVGGLAGWPCSSPVLEVRASMVEIYQEKIRDLLDATKVNLQLMDDKADGVIVADMTQREVTSVRELCAVLQQGIACRTTGATRMNVNSSRSHSLFILCLERKVAPAHSNGKLHLVDLAGSEKIKRTHAVGTRLDEAKKINQSLSALGNVINALTSTQVPDGTSGRAPHIPFRDSKLTRLLQDSLGGTAMTCLVLNCSGSFLDRAETISTLRFGHRAKQIKNQPIVHQTFSVSELLSQLNSTRKELEELKTATQQHETLPAPPPAQLTMEHGEMATVASSDHETHVPSWNRLDELPPPVKQGGSPGKGLSSRGLVSVTLEAGPLGLEFGKVGEDLWFIEAVNGQAAATNKLAPGLILLSVNAQTVSGLQHFEGVRELLVGAKRPVTLLFRPPPDWALASVDADDPQKQKQQQHEEEQEGVGGGKEHVKIDALGESAAAEPSAAVSAFSFAAAAMQGLRLRGTQSSSTSGASANADHERLEQQLAAAQHNADEQRKRAAIAETALVEVKAELSAARAAHPEQPSNDGAEPGPTPSTEIAELRKALELEKSRVAEHASSLKETMQRSSEAEAHMRAALSEAEGKIVAAKADWQSAATAAEDAQQQLKKAERAQEQAESLVRRGLKSRKAADAKVANVEAELLQLRSRGAELQSQLQSAGVHARELEEQLDRRSEHSLRHEQHSTALQSELEHVRAGMEAFAADQRVWSEASAAASKVGFELRAAVESQEALDSAWDELAWICKHSNCATRAGTSGAAEADDHLQQRSNALPQQSCGADFEMAASLWCRRRQRRASARARSLAKCRAVALLRQRPMAGVTQRGAPASTAATGELHAPSVEERVAQHRGCGARVLLREAAIQVLGQFEEIDAWLSEQGGAKAVGSGSGVQAAHSLDGSISLGVVRAKVNHCRELAASACQVHAAKLAQIGCCGSQSATQTSEYASGPSKQVTALVPAQPAVVLAEYERLLRFPSDVDVGLGIGADVSAAEVELRREVSEASAHAKLRDEACFATTALMEIELKLAHAKAEQHRAEMLAANATARADEQIASAVQVRASTLRTDRLKLIMHRTSASSSHAAAALTPLSPPSHPLGAPLAVRCYTGRAREGGSRARGGARARAAE